MQFKTLFRAYQMAESEKNRAVERRGGSFGIAVKKDPDALHYQKYDKLTRRIEARIEGVQVCPLCVAPYDQHYSFCRRFKKENQ